MAISKYTADREKQKFKESTAVAGQVAVVVVNPDGTSLGGTGTSSSQVQGASADNAPVTENPVLTGAEYNATPPTYGDGDKTTTQADPNGNTKVTSGALTGAAVPAGAFYMAGVSGGNLTGVAVVTPSADAVTTSVTSLAAVAFNDIYNGTNWDRIRSIINATNSTGTGIAAVGLVAQVDDTSPTAITENQFGNVRMSADRSLLTTQRATTPTTTSVASSASSVSLLAANGARKGAIITNDSSAVLYVKLGATASTSSYTVTIAGSGAAPFSSYEVPFGYVGVIDGIWASATGNARITEII